MNKLPDNVEKYLVKNAPLSDREQQLKTDLVIAIKIFLASYKPKPKRVPVLPEWKEAFTADRLEDALASYKPKPKRVPVLPEWKEAFRAELNDRLLSYGWSDMPVRFLYETIRDFTSVEASE
ncbi:MAG: hypothetical protein ABJA10_02795 [Aestuariivirga sp.]